MIRTIVVAVDDSRAAFRAASVAVELADRLGARLVAVSVLDGVLADVPLRVRPGPVPPPAGADALVAAQRHVRDLAARFGVEIDLCTVQGHVAECLLDEARRVDAGLIVVGRVDRPGVRLAHVGRTAEQVLEFSELPVLVVPAGRR